MKIIYIHHALRQKGNPPTQNDKIQPCEDLPFPMVSSCSPVGFKIDESCFEI
jgi:hypothetical protein